MSLSAQAFNSAVVKNCKPPGVILPGKRDQMNNFVVVHTIANVEYSSQGFLSKNKDILKSELCAMLQVGIQTTLATASSVPKGSNVRGLSFMCF